MRICRECGTRLFKYGYRQFPTDGREVIQKGLQRVSRFQVIKERLARDPRTLEWLHKLLASPETPTLGGVTAGNTPGRTDDRQITCHMNTSSGLQFAALGARIQANARKMGLGREIPDDRFLQELHP